MVGVGRGLLAANAAVQPLFQPPLPTGGTGAAACRCICQILQCTHTVCSACQVWKDKQHQSQHQARAVQACNAQRSAKLASTQLSQLCFLNKSEPEEGVYVGSAFSTT